MTALPGWDELPSPEGLAALDRVGEALSSGTPSDRVGATLRKEGVDPAFIAALLTQARLRQAGVAKFGDAARAMLFTQAGLEQATRQLVAAHHAARFLRAGSARVADLGCGIGAESRAFLAAGLGVRAVEIDPFTARIAAHNLGLAGQARGGDFEVLTGDAVLLGRGDADAVFLDPARRTSGHRDTRRLTAPEDYLPPLDFAFGHGRDLPTGVKLGPGFDRDLLPADAEAQWVSVDGAVVETGVWFGAAQTPGVGRSALVFRGGEAHELSAPADSPDVEVREPGEYLYEPDGAVIRARLIGLLAHELDAGMLGAGIAYLTSDRAVSTPFATGFRLLEELPAKEKELRRALTERGIGRLEIKKRGVDVDPAALRTRLKLRGDASGTLIVTRAAGRHVAYLAERISTAARAADASAPGSR
ncbi:MULTISPECIES: class I SAM-dependent methyltransferase [unclassified Leucobacter]|uniref:class I SAM-dependent methyltransferase n=1 Tax=unclassified Leucobacter TaxID=2621730 RepID=UPI00165EA334|nr:MULTISPECIES: class I SAM-dependent methyltransferase [unclassified Leucobacter]MBC9927609.1 class I SAM-dependent methyltransferase [Leucobacter sp. cx-169]